LSRRVEIQQRKENIQAQYSEGTEFVDIPLVEGDKVVGKTVAEVAANLPDDCVLVSIERSQSLIIPHGDTVFQAGDKITAFIRTQDATRLYQSLHGPEISEPVD